MTTKGRPRNNSDRAHQQAAGLAKFDPDRAAMALVEAVFDGDTRAAHKYNVTTRTIREWRNRLETDSAFSGIFLEKRREVYAHWIDELVPGILTHIRFGKAAVQREDYSPEMVAASSNALRTLLEAQFALELLHAGTGEQAGTNEAPDTAALTSANTPSGD